MRHATLVAGLLGLVLLDLGPASGCGGGHQVQQEAPDSGGGGSGGVGSEAGGDPVITLGPLQTLLPDGSFGLHYLPDEGTAILGEDPFRIITADGWSRSTVVLTASAGAADPLTHLVSSQIVLGPGGPGTFDNGYTGISALYRHTDGVFYGFYEAEDQEDLGTIPGTSIPGFYARIGLAYSSDGLAWTKAGYPIESFLPKRVPGGSVQYDQGSGEPGTAVSPDGKYLYVYYDEHSRVDGSGHARPIVICMARAPLASWPPSFPAAPGPVPGFTKALSGSFSTPGIDGVDSPVVSPPITSASAFQAHVAYSKTLRKFVMIYGVDAYEERILTGVAEVSGIYVAFSDDGVAWRPSLRPLIVDFANLWQDLSVSWQGSILWDAGSDTTGWLVYAHSPASSTTPPYLVGRRITLAPGSADAGTGDDGGGGPPVCTPITNPACGTNAQSCPAPSAVVTDAAHVTTGSSGIVYGVGDNLWVTYTAAAAGQTAPALSASAGGLAISASLSTPSVPGANWVDTGLYFDSSLCVDASAYSGVRFALAGDLGACSLSFSLDFSEDLASTDDARRGACAAATCYPPSASVTAPVTAAGTTVTIPFSALAGGTPVTTLDRTAVTALNWQLTTPEGADAGGCTASFTLSDVTFVP